MKPRKSKPKTSGAILVRSEVLDRVLVRLRDTEQKLDYLIKSLRQGRTLNGLNGHYAHLNHPLRESLD